MENQIKARIKATKESIKLQKATAEKERIKGHYEKASFFNGLATANEYIVEKLEKMLNK